MRSHIKSFDLFQGKHDSLARLGECFVRLQIDKITENNEECSREEIQRYIYNPNEMNFEMNLFHLFKPLADIVIENDKKSDVYDSPKARENGQLIRNQFSDIFQKVNLITRRQFNELMLNNSLRHDNGKNKRNNVNSHLEEIENVINAICHPATVFSACQMYIQQVRIESDK